jgi:hypothetical protein
VIRIHGDSGNLSPCIRANASLGLQVQILKPILKKQKAPFQVLFGLSPVPQEIYTNSAPEAIRTPNRLIRSQMLCPLSYGGDFDTSDPINNESDALNFA